jgi:hypothetical protein
VFVLSNGRKVPLSKLQDGQVVRVLSVQTTGDRKEISGEEELTNPKSEAASVT